MTRINQVVIALTLLMLIVAPLEIAQVALWILVHIFEIVEFSLDEIIHFFFHTSRHTTQVVVFYFMLILLIALAYYLGLKMRHLLLTLRKKSLMINYASVLSVLPIKPKLQRQKFR